MPLSIRSILGRVGVVELFVDLFGLMTMKSYSLGNLIHTTRSNISDGVIR